jgi:glycosyltransferase involved in cell wall biosynthesis
MLEKPRVLQVGPIPPPIDGGIAAYLEGMLQSSLLERFDLRPCNMRVPDLYRQRMLRPLLSVRFLARFGRTRRSARLVHIHYLRTGFRKVSVVSRADGHSALCCTSTGDFDRFLLDLPPRQAQMATRVLRDASAVLVPCAGWQALVDRFAGPGRVRVVPNAIRCDDFPPRPVARDRGTTRFLFLGFVSARKGLDELLVAVQELLRTGNRNFELEIVGGEEDRGQLAH